MSELFDELIQVQRDALAAMKNSETHTMDLNIEILKTSSPHFKKVDTHFEPDGLLCTYKCNLDGRDYFVKITTSKD
jgi:hypothetical protein